MAEHAPLFIGGKFVEASSGQRFSVISPFDESTVGSAADATIGDVAAAVGAARQAFDETSWAVDRDFRSHCLRQLQDGLRQEAVAIKEVQMDEAALPFGVCLLVDSVIEEMSFHIDLMEKFDWTIELPEYEILGIRSRHHIFYEPYGVVGAITPWNSPFLLNMWKSIPALSTGNTVVLKTAPDTPISGMLLARAIQRYTDIPAGVFNVISSSDNAIGGDGLTGDPRVDMFHFTGSTAVGQRIAERAAVGIRKVVLELGGKSANLVLEDADLDSAIPYSAGMCMLNSGQGCTVPSRLIVHERLYDDAVSRLADMVGQIPWGDPRDPANVVGPIISAKQVDRIEGLVNRAVAEGARLVAGGSRPPLEKGFWFEPTVLADVDENSEIAQTEVFGPVLSVMKYSGSDDEAVRIANNSEYGLSGYIQSADSDRAMALAKRIRSGTINIGPSMYLSPYAPFGGYKKSGLGREHGVDGWREFLQSKNVATPAPQDSPATV